MKEYVFSTTLDKVKKAAILIKSEIEKEVQKIKNESGMDIWLFGSAGLTSSLMNLGLVEECSLAVHPFIVIAEPSGGIRFHGY
jgi:dihydrofolate reductase